jgi:hypothetical protein
METLKLRIDAERLGERRTLLSKLDALKHGIDDRDTLAGLTPFGRQAVDLLLGGATAAFDLTKEKRSTL